MRGLEKAGANFPSHVGDDSSSESTTLSEPKAPVLGTGDGESCALFPMICHMAEPIKKQLMCVGRGKGRDGPRKEIFSQN